MDVRRRDASGFRWPVRGLEGVAVWSQVDDEGMRLEVEREIWHHDEEKLDEFED